MCRSYQPTIPDAREVDAFAERLLDTLNQGALSLMLSIGHRTGLFDAMAEIRRGTVEEIASHAGLTPRYVREWLGAMVTGDVVDYEPATETYRLPPNRAAVLCRDAAPDNIAVFAQYVGVLGQVEDRIVDCFREGGGLGYEHYPRFHEVMAEDSHQTVLCALDEYILPLLGTRTLREMERGTRILDVGCGQGRALRHLAERFPKSEFVGYELSADAVAEGRQAARSARLDNLVFEQRDLTDFDRHADENMFGVVLAFDAVHDQATPDAVLRGIYRTLTPQGTFLMQDIRASSRLENNLDHPIAPLLYTISTMHCMSVSLAQGGAGLGTMWGEELALEMLRDAGFEDVEVHRPEHDFQNNFYVTRKAAAV